MSQIRHGSGTGVWKHSTFPGKMEQECARQLSSKAQPDDSEMKLSEGKAESEEARSKPGQPGVLDPKLGYREMN